MKYSINPFRWLKWAFLRVKYELRLWNRRRKIGKLYFRFDKFDAPMPTNKKWVRQNMRRALKEHDFQPPLTSDTNRYTKKQEYALGSQYTNSAGRKWLYCRKKAVQ